MITPIKTMTINQIIERQDDLLVSLDDVKAIAKNEREKVLNKVLKILANEKWDYTLVNKIEQLKEQR